MPSVSLLAGILAVGTAHAQLTFNCPPVAASEFKQTTLVARSTGIEEPIKMTFDTDAQGNVDIYWVERKGKVKKYAAATKAVTTLGSVTIYPGYEDGLTGIALDPNFKTNRWMYLYYSQGTDKDFKFRVSRFTLDGQGNMDNASEKPIIEIPAYASHMHTGGAMLFDEGGNLWITTGENQAGEEGTSNTNDLRGKILRIHPEATAGTDGKFYTIPAGNLFPAGTAKTRPEIYVMGCRNPYSLTRDPVKKAITWGDIGPDGKGQTEEHNYTTVPGNFGYPYFAGNNVALQGNAPASAPVNTNAKNTGLAALPPAIPAIDPYQQLAAITGPIYRYNGMSKSTVKFPPHFDGLWFVGDFQNSKLDTIHLNAAGTAIASKGSVFPTFHFYGPIDMQMGPDGAMYIINYAGWFGAATETSIIRIEYTGSCRPEIATAIAVPERAMVHAAGMDVEVDGSEGHHVLAIADLQGRALASFEGYGFARYNVARAVGNRPGLYVAKLTTNAGVSSRTLLLGGR
jgi:glucose/arabinose dehydrogenase